MGDAGRGGTGAHGEGEDDGAEVDEDEKGGEPEGHFWGVVAEEHVEVEGGEGVEEGTAGYEEGLDDHWSVGFFSVLSCRVMGIY